MEEKMKCEDKIKELEKIYKQTNEESKIKSQQQMETLKVCTINQ